MLLGLAIALAVAVTLLLLLPLWRFSRDRPVYHPFTLPLLGKYPAFEDPEDYPWLGQFRDNYPAINDELRRFTEDTHSHGIPSNFSGLQSTPESWKLIPLTKNDQPDRFSPVAEQRFPKTVEALEQIPGMFSAYFSHLEPHAQITPHRGEGDAYVRVHLGMQVPMGLPECGFEVAGERRSWGEGEVLIFNDLHRHTAFNQTDRGRSILMFDVMRPRHASSKERHMQHKYELIRASFSLANSPWYLKPVAYLRKQRCLLRAMTS